MKQAARDELAARLEHLDGLAQSSREEDEMTTAEWLWAPAREDIAFTVASEPVAARGLLQKLIVSPITVTPEVASGKAVGWSYSGLGCLDRVLEGRLLMFTTDYPPRRQRMRSDPRRG